MQSEKAWAAALEMCKRIYWPSIVADIRKEYDARLREEIEIKCWKAIMKDFGEKEDILEIALRDRIIGIIKKAIQEAKVE